MCGIVGFYDGEDNKEQTIKKMTDKIAHRGPDSDGYYTDENIALGHRRLSIIDLSNGMQPMFSENKNLVVIFNGEIYNYKELQEELKEKGYNFSTNSDTEVLIYGYAEWKEELPKRLRGMFAFAIWDKENKTLFCSRDNFGIKPLYYYKDDDVFMFASEIKALLEYPKFKKVLNKELIGAYLTFGFTPTAETLFKGVFCLEPGHSLTLSNNEIKIEQYFDISFEEKDITFEEAIEEISNTMKDSVKAHMISDVEVGSFLSSGIDSSYIVSLARPDKTYTIGYNDSKYSEISYAENLAEKLGINNTSRELEKGDYIKAVGKILYHMDEPSSDPSIISLYYVSNLAKKYVKVALSGEGADEFFGGYNTYREGEDFKLYNKIPYFIRHFLAVIIRNFPDFKGRDFIVRRGTKLEEEYVGVNRVFSDKEVCKVLKFKDTVENKEITKPTLDKVKDKSNIIKMQLIDIKHWLVRDILLKSDKMTMANSIEVRLPFVDKEVFKMANSLKSEYKVSKTDTKVALREAAKKDIPTEAYKKKKLGFPVPIREWMREEDIYQEIKKTLSQDFVKELFNQDYVLNMLEQHKNNKKDNYRKIWSIYSFIKWYEIFFLDKYKELDIA